jgi:replicative DNA helicase
VSIAELPNNRAPRDTNISSIGADFERTPPQDVSAELSVLGGMILSKVAFAVVIEISRDRDFYRPAH